MWALLVALLDWRAFTVLPASRIAKARDVTVYSAPADRWLGRLVCYLRAHIQKHGSTIGTIAVVWQAGSGHDCRASMARLDVTTNMPWTLQDPSKTET